MVPSPTLARSAHPIPVVRGEAALAVVVVINSLGVLLMLRSGSGISAISSVPYAFSLVLPFFTLGTWTYLFQGALILSLMVLRKKLVIPYLFSFVVGFFFGKMLDLHQLWTDRLPVNLPLRVAYFALSYLLICFGIALSNRCKMPIIPTDLFPRQPDGPLRHLHPGPGHRQVSCLSPVRCQADRAFFIFPLTTWPLLL